MGRVSAYKAKRYDPALLGGVVNKIFEDFSLDEKIRPGMKVVLKPNLLMRRRPEEFTTTNPAVVAAVCNKLHEIGVKDITICDSPGGPYLKQYIDVIYRVSGMTSVKYAKLNGDFSSKKVKIAGKVCDEFDIITPLLEADFIINLPKLKTHGMMVLSGAVKNMFGAVPGLLKPELHYRYPEKEKFAGMIVDLCQFLKPNFTLVDAVVSMDGDGPSSGTKNKSELIIAAENPFQLDTVMCHIIGLDTKYVPICQVAFARGLAVPYKAQDIMGDADIASWPLNFKAPISKPIENLVRGTFLRKITYKLLSSKPRVIKKDCIGCGKCAESCPAKTIDIVSGKAIINYKNCIKCYCCHEMCPVKAIVIQRSPLLRGKP